MAARSDHERFMDGETLNQIDGVGSWAGDGQWGPWWDSRADDCDDYDPDYLPEMEGEYGPSSDWDDCYDPNDPIRQ